MSIELARYALDHVWAVPEQRLPAMVGEAIRCEASDLKAIHESIAAARADVLSAAHGRQSAGAGSVAVIPIYGGITHRPDLWSVLFGGSTVQGIRKAFRQALADETVSSIVFDMDTPGGTVDGITEFAAEIFGARGIKPMVAQVNTMTASAGLWLAAQADEIAVTPSGEIGSIGVFTAHEYIGKALAEAGVEITLISAGDYKVEGNQFEPLSDDARGAIQARVNAVYWVFNADMARGRGVSVADVKAKFGQGRMFGAREAVSVGLADRVATLDDTLRRVSSGQGRRAVAVKAAEHAGMPIVADAALCDAAVLPNLEDLNVLLASTAEPLRLTLAEEPVTAGIDLSEEPDQAAIVETAADRDQAEMRLTIARLRQGAA